MTARLIRLNHFSLSDDDDQDRKVYIRADKVTAVTETVAKDCTKIALTGGNTVTVQEDVETVFQELTA